MRSLTHLKTLVNVYQLDAWVPVAMSMKEAAKTPRNEFLKNTQTLKKGTLIMEMLR